MAFYQVLVTALQTIMNIPCVLAKLGNHPSPALMPQASINQGQKQSITVKGIPEDARNNILY
jgi:hypothetical protein